MTFLFFYSKIKKENKITMKYPRRNRPEKKKHNIVPLKPRTGPLREKTIKIQKDRQQKLFYSSTVASREVASERLKNCHKN